VRTADNLTIFMCRFCVNSGSLNILEPEGSVQTYLRLLPDDIGVRNKMSVVMLSSMHEFRCNVHRKVILF